MKRHFWIVGTDTDIGKTLVTTYFMRYFQNKGENVIPYKPVQTRNHRRKFETILWGYIFLSILQRRHLSGRTL